MFLLQPWFTNLSKRLIKTPKLYFCDPGIAGWLLGVRKPEHLTAHPQRGSLFGNWVMTELLKAQTKRGTLRSIFSATSRAGRSTRSSRPVR